MSFSVAMTNVQYPGASNYYVLLRLPPYEQSSILAYQAHAVRYTNHAKSPKSDRTPQKRCALSPSPRKSDRNRRQLSMAEDYIVRSIDERPKRLSYSFGRSEGFSDLKTQLSMKLYGHILGPSKACPYFWAYACTRLICLCC